MSTRTGKSLTADQVRKFLGQLELRVPREACWSCECLQAFLTQLELDATSEARAVLDMYKVRPERLHGCLGCEPCSPADLCTALGI